jgi:tetratricopeptide (TPR) repeat protein
VALRRARRVGVTPPTTLRWLRLACLLAPRFGEAHQLLVARTSAADPMRGMAEARRWTTRFERDSDAWVSLGAACRVAYRTRDALVAYEHALQIDERPDAAFAAGLLYRMQQDHVTAGARFARAYAAGDGSDALRENARSLTAAGDHAAAAEAKRLWEQETGKAWAD